MKISIFWYGPYEDFQNKMQYLKVFLPQNSNAACSTVNDKHVKKNPTFYSSPREFHSINFLTPQFMALKMTVFTLRSIIWQTMTGLFCQTVDFHSQMNVTMSQTLSVGQNCFPSIDVEFVSGSLCVTVKSTNAWLAQPFSIQYSSTILIFALE